MDINQNVAGIKVSDFKALVGGHSQSTPSGNQKVIEIKRIVVHPGWNSQNINNDLALVELVESIGLENSNLNAICIGSPSDNVEGQEAIISGWGLLKDGDTSIPDILQRANVDVKTQKSCESSYSWYVPISRNIK